MTARGRRKWAKPGDVRGSEVSEQKEGGKGSALAGLATGLWGRWLRTLGRGKKLGCGGRGQAGQRGNGPQLAAGFFPLFFFFSFFSILFFEALFK